MERLSKRQRISEPSRYSQLHTYNHDQYNYERQTADELDNYEATDSEDNVTQEAGRIDSDLEDGGEDSLDEDADGNIYSEDEDVEDENAGLAHLRAQASQKLKSRFESIFEKYGKDFSGVGDEIDLETGEIVVNNGHLVDMQDETDAGQLGEGKGILRALTVEPTNQYVESDKADNDKRPYIMRRDPTLQVDDSEEEEEEGDEDGIVDDVDDSEASFAAVGANNSMGRPVNTTGLENKTSYPSNTEILEQFGPDLGPEIIKVVSRQRQAGEGHIEPAWRVPGAALPPPRKKPKLMPLPTLELSTEERSPSPIGNRSIWAPQVGPGRPRKHGVFSYRNSSEGRHSRAGALPYKPGTRNSRISSGMGSRRKRGRPPKRHSTGALGTYVDRPRSSTTLGSPVLDTFEDGIGQILGESSQNLQPSLISNARSFRLRPRGPARRDPESISWAEAVAAVEEIDPHLYAGLIEDAKGSRQERRARSYSVDSFSSTSSFGDDVELPRATYLDEDMIARRQQSASKGPKHDGSKLTARECKPSSAQLARNAVLNSLLGGIEDPEQIIQYVGTTIEGTHHRVAAIPCPHIDCSSLTTTLYRCQCIGNENSSQITNHLRDVHNTTPYPCEEPGCHRRGGKGYFRSRDLAKHVKIDHPGIAAYDRLRPRIGEATFNLYDCYAAERNSTKPQNQDQEPKSSSLSATKPQRKNGIFGRVIPGPSNLLVGSSQSENTAPVNSIDEEDDAYVANDYSFESEITTNATAVFPREGLRGQTDNSTSRYSINTKSPTQAKTSVQRNIRFLIPASDDDSSVMLSSAPPSQEIHPRSPPKPKSTEMISRNRIDPSYEFSDEEDCSQAPPHPPSKLQQLQKSDKIAPSPNLHKKVKRGRPTKASKTKKSNQKHNFAEYIHPCQYRGAHNCRRMFRELKVAQRHSKSHEVNEVFSCTEPGCSRWFGTPRALWRHGKDNHATTGKTFPAKPEYLSDVSDAENHSSAEVDPLNNGYADEEDLPPPYSSPLTVEVPKNGRHRVMASPTAQLNTTQIPEEQSDAELPIDIEDTMENSKSFSSGEQPNSTTIATACILSTAAPVNQNLSNASITTTRRTDRPTKAVALNGVPSQDTQKKEGLQREAPHQTTVDTSTSPLPSVKQHYLASTTLNPQSQQTSTESTPQLTARQQHSPTVRIAKSTAQIPGAMMLPPPVSLSRAEVKKHQSSRLSTPQPQRETLMLRQAKEARKRASLPMMIPRGSSSHSRPVNKIHRSVEPGEDDDLDELDIAFDSPALMGSRAGSVAQSSVAKKLPTLFLLKGPAKNQATPSTLSYSESTVPSQHFSFSTRRNDVRITGETSVRLSDMASAEERSRNSFATPVKKRRSVLLMDDGGLTEDLVKTPGGTLRRCGEEGFSCERDFCFSCT